MSVRRGTGSALASELRIRSQTDITRVRSGGCKPAVALGDVLAQAPPQMSGRLPTGVFTKAVAVVVAKPRGAYAPRSCSRACPPA